MERLGEPVRTLFGLPAAAWLLTRFLEGTGGRGRANPLALYVVCAVGHAADPVSWPVT